MDVVSYSVLVLAIYLLVWNWIVGEQQTSTKVIFTAAYLLTWLLLFVGWWVVTAAQAVFCIVVGTVTFGIDWMMERRPQDGQLRARGPN